jgi:fructose-bisphosphate aldolase class 1
MNAVTTAAELVRHGKGILAADESVSTMNDRLARAGVVPTAETRRAYREMLVTTPHLAEGVSGVILCDETFRQVTADGQTFPEVLASRGLLPGIKVDTGTRPLAGVPAERVTEGLDGLRERLAEYVSLAALQHVPAPWPLTFSFGRALVDPALAAWRGDPRRVRAGQRALANRVACNLAALRGGYRPADAGNYALA